MTENNKKKAEIIDFLTKKPISLDPTKTKTVSNNRIKGNSNILAGGDVTVNLNPKVIKTNKIAPGPEHITEKQAYKIQQLIHSLAERDALTAFDGDIGKARKKWWSILKRHFEVSSYRLLPQHLFEDAVQYLRQHKAMTRAKLRAPATKARWRNEHYASIFAKAKDLGISKGELYAILSQRLDIRIISLKKISDQNLKKAYHIIRSL